MAQYGISTICNLLNFKGVCGHTWNGGSCCFR